MPEIKGSRADHIFSMVRPPLEFTFRNVRLNWIYYIISRIRIAYCISTRNTHAIC